MMAFFLYTLFSFFIYLCSFNCSFLNSLPLCLFAIFFSLSIFFFFFRRLPNSCFCRYSSVTAVLVFFFCLFVCSVQFLGFIGRVSRHVVTVGSLCLLLLFIHQITEIEQEKEGKWKRGEGGGKKTSLFLERELT